MLNDEQRLAIAEISLEGFRQRWENGSSIALFEALQCCGKLKVPMPDWCEKALSGGLAKLYGFQSKSLDDVFGAPFPKRLRLDALKRESDFAPVIYNLCETLKAEGASVGPGLFESVSDHLKEAGILFIEKTTVETYYYRYKKVVELLKDAGLEKYLPPPVIL